MTACSSTSVPRVQDEDSPRDPDQDPGADRTSPHPIRVQAHLLQPRLNYTGPLPRPPSHSECDHVAWEPTRRLHAP